MVLFVLFVNITMKIRNLITDTIVILKIQTSQDIVIKCLVKVVLHGLVYDVIFAFDGPIVHI